MPSQCSLNHSCSADAALSLLYFEGRFVLEMEIIRVPCRRLTQSWCFFFKSNYVHPFAAKSLSSRPVQALQWQAQQKRCPERAAPLFLTVASGTGSRRPGVTLRGCSRPRKQSSSASTSPRPNGPTHSDPLWREVAAAVSHRRGHAGHSDSSRSIRRAGDATWPLGIVT